MPKYERGDYVKIEIPDEQTGIGEWLWMRVDHCDEAERLVFGVLDNEPLSTRDIALGDRLAVSYDNVRDHKKPWKFTE